MSSSSQLVTVPFPRRLNTDTPPGQLTPDETPVLKNVMPRALPYEVRPRNGIVAMATGWALHTNGNPGVTQFYSKPATWIPYWAGTSADSDSIIVGLVDQGGSGQPDWTFYYSSRDVATQGAANRAASGAYGTGIQFPLQKPGTTYGGSTGYVQITGLKSSGVAGGSFPDTGTVQSGVVYTTPTYLTAAMNNRNIRTNALTFWGQPTHYDGVTFYCTGDSSYFINSPYLENSAGYTPFSTGTKYYDSTMSGSLRYVSRDEGRVWVWGGKPVNQYSWPTYTIATLTNGSANITGHTHPDVTGYLFGVGVTPPTFPTAPNPAYSYLYKVRQSSYNLTSTPVTSVLEHPYGLGEGTGNVPNYSGGNIVGYAHSTTILRNSPVGAYTTALFRDRVFAARALVSATLTTGGPQALPSPVGDYGGSYDSAVMWSKPGNWNRWPDQNFALVGDFGDGDTPVTALAAMSDRLVIFKASKMYVLTGYDEDSFTLSKVSDVIGCPYPNGVASYEGSLYFLNQDGVYKYDGESLTCLTEPQPGRGITSLWNTRKWSRAQGCKVNYFWPTMAVTPEGHLLVVCHYPLTTTDYADNFVYDIKNDCWAEWGLETKSANPIRVVQAPNGRVYGIHRWFISELTDMFNPAVDGPKYDVYPNINSGSSYTNIVPEIEVWWNPGTGHTARLREVQLDHECRYAHTTSGTDYRPWVFQIATDPDLTLSSNQHYVKARWIDSATYSATQPYHFSDRFPETWQREGQLFRIKFTGDSWLFNMGDGEADRVKSRSLTQLKITVDITRQMGVDNSTT